jgi:hypothetical protein
LKAIINIFREFKKCLTKNKAFGFVNQDLQWDVFRDFQQKIKSLFGIQ